MNLLAGTGNRTNILTEDTILLDINFRTGTFQEPCLDERFGIKIILLQEFAHKGTGLVP
jgi:hypothetical protein